MDEDPFKEINCLVTVSVGKAFGSIAILLSSIYVFDNFQFFKPRFLSVRFHTYWFNSNSNSNFISKKSIFRLRSVPLKRTLCVILISLITIKLIKIK